MNINITSQSHTDAAADLLAIAVTEDNMAARLADLNGAFDGALISALENDEFKAKAGSSASYPSFGKITAGRLLIVGLGEGDAMVVQQAAGAAGKAARASGADSVALDMGGLDAAQSQIAVEGFIAGNYKFDKYKTAKDKKSGASRLTSSAEPTLPA